MSRKIGFLLILVVSSLVVGCGGSSDGNGGGSLYDLFPSEAFDSGFSESYVIAGSDSNGQLYSGRFFSRTLAVTEFNGDEAVPITSSIEITNNQTGAALASSGTEFYRVNQSSYELLGFTSDVASSVSASAVAVPAVANIGGFGAVGSYTDSAGNTRVVSWRLEAAGDGNANYVVSTTTTDQSGDIVDTSVTIQTINTEGIRQAVELQITSPESGVTLTLTGTRN